MLVVLFYMSAKCAYSMCIYIMNERERIMKSGGKRLLSVLTIRRNIRDKLLSFQQQKIFVEPVSTKGS